MAKKEQEPVTDTPFDFETHQFNTLEDFDVWNYHCHKAFREAKKLNPKANPPVSVRVPDESFHKKVRIKFQRFDQPENVLKVKCHTKEISWEGQLKPGKTYDLPLPVVRFINRLATPIFGEVKVEDGGDTRTETKQIGERNRFSCHLLEMV